MRLARAIIASLVVLCCAVAQTVEEKIAAVEHGLTPGIVLKNRPWPKLTIAGQMEALHVHGVSVAVIHNFKIDWAKGYGVADVASGRKVNTETLFQAGSISKPVAATAALKLVEEGKLSLDEDVNKKLKSWKVPENDFTAKQKVTLRRLLSHTAGLTVHGFPGYDAGEPVPAIPQVLDGAKPANTPAVRVDVEPGTIWRYSGGGYTIAQLLMTDVTGRAFPDILHDLVIAKIGMSHSTYENPLPEKFRPNAASAYDSKGNPIPGKYHTYPEMAAAGLWTTASDLALFAIEIGKSRAGESNRVLKKTTVEEMLTPVKEGYGLGFGIQTHGSVVRFQHNGADEGFQALLVCGSDGNGAAIMVNSDNGIELAMQIARAVAAAYEWGDHVPVERATIDLPAKELEAFAGTYEFSPAFRITARLAKDHLVVNQEGRDFDYYPESESTFFALDGAPKAVFQKDAAGKVTGMRVGSEYGKRVQ